MVHPTIQEGKAVAVPHPSLRSLARKPLWARDSTDPRLLQPSSWDRRATKPPPATRETPSQTAGDMWKVLGNCRGSSGEKKFEGRVSTEDDDITASGLNTILGDVNNHDDDDDDYDYT